MTALNNKHHFCLAACIAMLISMTGCSLDIGDSSDSKTLFEQLPAEQTNIHFRNELSFSPEFNILKYQNFYNGGGVGIGDINNDSLPDIYMTANQKTNNLYLNRGGFRFKDITEEAGVGGTKKWSTGVSMVDINADGWLDIYVSNAGNTEGEGRKNELFINNGDGTFSEKAEKYGLADTGFTVHAAFFDYDRDGDLDVYMLNNSNFTTPDLDNMEAQRTIRDQGGGDRLYENDDGFYRDVSTEAGIYGSIIGRGLGVSVSDLNRDGFPDLFISNDFFEHDYIYMNNGDGTFREVMKEQLRSTSVASMGADIADLSGDGFPEIFVTEMLPESDERLKRNLNYNSWEEYQYFLENSFFHQFTRNVLHYNKGPIPGKGMAFSEIGRMAGVEATGWSWAANIMDMDNDGLKDLFVANGIYRDVVDNDYTNYASEPRRELFMRQGNKMVVDLEKLIGNMPSVPISNYGYKGEDNLSFTNKTIDWGLGEKSFSSGSAYGDLDNDGDLDLVVNNVNMASFVYRNRSTDIHPENNYLKVNMKGSEKNINAVGAQLTVKAGGQQFYLEQIPNRGFQSSVDNRPNFGLGRIRNVDSLIVDWPSGRRSVLTGLKTNQTITIEEKNASVDEAVRPMSDQGKQPIFSNISHRYPLSYRHSENEYNDFKKNPMLFHMRSTEGPKADNADINGDGLQDLYIGGAKGSAGQLLIKNVDGSYRLSNRALLEADKEAEDLGCLFFDADGDGDQDLYVTSGGVEAMVGSASYADRLYINAGNGKFRKSDQALPSKMPQSTSVVTANDIEGDGDLDLFVGVRLRPGLAGIPQSSYMLENDGNGIFKNVTDKAAPGLKDIGMVTDASWGDYDGDGDRDLVVVGKWMTIKLFENDGKGTFSEQTKSAGLGETAGWWNVIKAADLEGDGDLDFVAGNLGTNSIFRATPEKPMRYYISDFDRNGSFENIITLYKGEKSYPLLLRNDLLAQLPRLKSKYPTHASYAGQTMDDIFTKRELEGAITHTMTMLESVVLRNRGDGTFQVQPLPRAAQVAPVYAILLEDIDGDAIMDVVLGGNLHNVKPQVGIYNSSYGTYLKGSQNGELRAVKARHSGLALEGEVRDFVKLSESSGKQHILIVRNDTTSQVWEVKK